MIKMLKTICLAVCTACALFAQGPKTFTGVITDTMCGSKPHANMMKDKTDADCARLCAHGAYGLALFDGTTVMKLSDQKTSQQYAGRHVRVTGVYDEKSKTLKVGSIEPADAN
jgi:hypothetical protein